jgi:hypothetical protein
MRGAAESTLRWSESVLRKESVETSSMPGATAGERRNIGKANAGKFHL